MKTLSPIVFLLLFGCGPGGLFLPNVKDYTPEQLDAYKNLGYDAIRCVNVQGPPPFGNVTTVTIPKDRKATVKFNGCNVQSIEVGTPQEQNSSTTIRPSVTGALPESLAEPPMVVIPGSDVLIMGRPRGVVVPGATIP